MMHQIGYGFYLKYYEMVEIGPKNLFFCSFEELFLFMPSYTLWVTPQDFTK